MTLTHTLAETKVQNNFISSMIKIKYSMIIHQYTYTRVTLINTTWWQGKEYRDVNMTCTQECAIVVACHHSMNMHDGNQQLPFPSCLSAFYALAIPMSCYISNVFYYL